MKIIGAGWVKNGTYGTLRKQTCGDYARRGELYRSLTENGILAERTSKFGRFNRSTQQAFCAAALALHDADFSNDWKNVGLIGTGQEECTPANQAYFEDYAENGRRMARANLFIYTLPTSPLAEIAIHFKLDGPLFFSAAVSAAGSHLMKSAAGLLTENGTSQVLALWMEHSGTVALLLDAEEGDIPEEVHSLDLKYPERAFGISQKKRPAGEWKNTDQLIDYLKENL